MDTEGRSLWEDTGRVSSDDASTSQGMPRIISDLQKLRRSKGGFSSRAFRAWLQHLDFRLLASRTT